MKIEGMKRELVMLSEIDCGETFTLPDDTRFVFVRTTEIDTTNWYICMSLQTGVLFSFPETKKVVKCNAKVVVE